MSGMERLARAQLVKLEVDRLAAEAAVSSDLDRIQAISAEMDVLYASLLEIRREQLVEQVERSQPKPKRSWWERLLGTRHG
jgi:hypothetical protein